ncbi:30S ribosomal protein S3 [Campylobacter jejuni]|uniref:30S ribosomal protein S3 n=1 Tax=Campylobacter jejuni TaxID=197 RepID=UPI0007079252|nr:30S ribosomal protein S3 [Campylobacter jejuni]KQI22142.1 30S ribosomal protein S3 [Campylobacter jejuni CVM 41910]
MGQKVNPIGLRLGINRNWESRWFPTKANLVENIGEDYKIRAFLKRKLYYAGISQILVERTAKKLRVTVVAARPGIIIGKKGSDVDNLRKELQDLIGKDVNINIKEERKAGASAQLAAESVATQLEKRIAFRRAMKKVIQGAQKAGATSTLRAKIDYGFAEARTTYGNIGVKVWIFKGEVLHKGMQPEKTEESAPAKKPRRTRRGK